MIHYSGKVPAPKNSRRSRNIGTPSALDCRPRDQSPFVDSLFGGLPIYSMVRLLRKAVPTRRCNHQRYWRRAIFGCKPKRSTMINKSKLTSLRRWRRSVSRRQRSPDRLIKAMEPATNCRSPTGRTAPSRHGPLSPRTSKLPSGRATPAGSLFARKARTDLPLAAPAVFMTMSRFRTRRMAMRTPRQ